MVVYQKRDLAVKRNHNIQMRYNMKIAYLISCYMDPVQLGRLVKALNDENVDFFIHVDKKVDAAPFRGNISLSNITWVEPRVTVEWGANSQVQVLMKMLESALQKGAYDRYISMTGTDYPIYSNEEIRNFFNKNVEKEFIAGKDKTTHNPEIEGRYYTGDLILTLPKVLAKVLRRCQHIFFSLPFIRREPYTYINGKKAHIWSGSEYWALSHACAAYVLKTYSKEKELQKFIKYTKIPSERVVQTIVFNSEFKDRAVEAGCDVSFQDVTLLHKVEYTDQIKIYTEKDFEELVNSKKIFFRKAYTGKSDRLLELMDERRGLNE